MSLKMQSTNPEVIVIGFIHDNEKLYHMLIPSELYVIFVMFYPPNYKLYAIGFGYLGLPPKYSQFKDKNENKRWKYLPTMSTLCDNATFVCCANDNVFIRTMNDEIYAVGNNLYGSLGIDSKQGTVYEFKKVRFKNNAIDKYHKLDIMSTGSFTSHSFVALKHINTDRQTFYGFGKNAHKQQGYKSKQKYINIATKSPALNSLFEYMTISQIRTGYSHSLFLTAKGKVYSCGDNSYGQCGVRLLDNISVRPQIVPFLYDITAISSGGNHNLCIDKQNRVWVFGDNGAYQLGLGEAYKEANKCKLATMNPYFKGDVDENSIVFIECGDDFSLCISKNGKAFMFGANDAGQCGNGQEDDIYIPFCIQSMDAFKHILFGSGSLGCDHTQLISFYPQNNLYGFGSNSYHQTGNIKDVEYQTLPYSNTKADIGADGESTIVGVLCDQELTVAICRV